MELKIEDIKLYPVQIEYLQTHQDMSDKERDILILQWYDEGMTMSNIVAKKEAEVLFDNIAKS